ncbi:MAG TPA: hypothetical protein VGC54_09285 [Planctomycetota bacterium]
MTQRTRAFLRGFWLAALLVASAAIFSADGIAAPAPDTGSGPTTGANPPGGGTVPSGGLPARRMP